MKHRVIALVVSLVCAGSPLLAPSVTTAGRTGGRAGGGVAGHGRPPGFHHGGGFYHAAPRHHFGGRQHFGPRPFVRRAVPFGAISAASFVYAPPFVYGSPFSYDAISYAPPAYDAPPASYGPDMGGAISLAPPPQPTPTVVEFPTGRYELRGDGMATPYTWVWIPNPPVAPPPSAPGPGDPPPSSHRQLYRWTDEAGAAHWTDRWDAVPQAYRAEAQQPRLP
jgi:hypothetical protein